MSESRPQSLFSMLIAVAALLVAVISLYHARTARQLALSEISIEEKSALTTPVFDQAAKKWSYLALYELSVTNHSGPDVTLARVAKDSDGAGFLVPLDEQRVVGNDISYRAFLSDRSIAEIRSNPRLLKTLAQTDMGDAARVDRKLARGESTTIRLGVSLDVYDEKNEPLVNVVLLSYRLDFSNGKTYYFRRGFPILPLKEK